MVCSPSLWNSRRIPASGLLKAERTFNTLCFLQPSLSHSSEGNLTTSQSGGADHSQRSRKSPGSYPPLLRTTPSWSVWAACRFRRITNYEADWITEECLRIKPAVLKTWSNSLFERTFIGSSFFWQPNLYLGVGRKGVGGGQFAGRQLTKEDQSKSKAGRRFHGGGSMKRGSLWDSRLWEWESKGEGGWGFRERRAGGLSTSPRPRCCFFWESLLSRPWMSESSSASNRLSSETRLAWDQLEWHS